MHFVIVFNVRCWTVKMEPKTLQVICLSGKRFNGKGEVANMLKSLFEKKGKTVTITCFSYALKKTFCEKNGLDLDRFINDHDYKNSYRDALTAYYDETDPTIFTQATIDLINLAKSDVYIIDDLRCLHYQVEYMNKLKKTELKHWDLTLIRINASSDERQKRGWIQSSYDEHYCENELDFYDKFDLVIENNGTRDELFIMVHKWFECS